MNYSLPEFLAHAIALEREAQERYLELADVMEAHRNLDTAKVFRDMARFSQMHGDEIAERAKHVELRKLNSWEFRWRMYHEVGDDDGVHYLMTARHALKYARENENPWHDLLPDGGRKKPGWGSSTPRQRVCRRGKGHVEALDRWIEKTPSSSTNWMEDGAPVQAQR